MKKSTASKTLNVDLQLALAHEDVPLQSQFEQWAAAALLKPYRQLELTIRLVDYAESQALNRDFRGKDAPTNVLSFSAEDDDRLDYDYLGDLVICAPLVLDEASQQNKTADAHWAHLVVHGVLHLQGHDHESEEQAEKMEAIEIEILQSLGHTNPYQHHPG